MLLRLLLISILTLALASPARADGEDLPPGPHLQPPSLIDRDNRVHGFRVNWIDTHFYAGDTAAFNAFVADYAKLPNAKLRVVIHPGTLRAASPWDKQDRGLAADWSLWIWNTDGRSEYPTQVDLYLGSRITLKDLVIPNSIEVASGGEIERFIAARKPAAAAATRSAASARALTPMEAAEHVDKDEITVEFGVGEATLLEGLIREGDDPRPPLRLVWDNFFVGGGTFEIILQADAAGRDRNQIAAKAKSLLGRGIRATGTVKRLNSFASPSYQIIVTDPAKFAINP